MTKLKDFLASWISQSRYRIQKYSWQATSIIHASFVKFKNLYRRQLSSVKELLKLTKGLFVEAMNDTITVTHNKAPNRIRIRVPLIKHRQTYANLLKHELLSDEEAKGIYHAEANIVTGTLLVKFHPAFHSEEEVVQRVLKAANKLRKGEIEITEKHKNPKLGKMAPGAFFTRELLVNIVGNVVAGVLVAAIAAG